MPDDTTKRGKQDRARVSGSQEHELRRFAEKHGITQKEASELIRKFGNDRKTLDAEAKKLKGRS